jgi:hypothetical protein
VICGSFGVPNGFKDTSPRSQNILDIFLSNNLNFPTMVGREAQFTIYKQKSGNNSIGKTSMLCEYINIRTSLSEFKQSLRRAAGDVIDSK